MNDLTILIPINQGISYRYILQTNIFSSIQKKAKKIIILVPNPSDPFYNKIRSYNNVIIEDYRDNDCEAYLKSSKIHNILRLASSFIQNAKYDITTTKGHHEVFLQDHNKDNQGYKGKIFLWIINQLVILGRESKLIRKFILLLENLYFSSNLHFDIFKKFNPDLLIVTSLGTFNYDQLFMRQARKHKTKVISVILSWDNTTTRGYPSATSDLIITWTDIMKKELIHLNDIDETKIEVGGVAHYDQYFNNNYLYSRDELYDILNINSDLNLIFFATKSPNCYASNEYISRLIVEAINKKQLIKECQLLVRLHPIYFRMNNSELLFSNYIEDFEKLSKRNDRLTINQPQIKSTSLNYSMPEDEIKLLASILKYSSLVVNVFSTLNIEASIFDIPTVNISFEGEIPDSIKKARLNINQDLNETHNQRILKSGGVETVYDPQKLISTINMELMDPSKRQKGRQYILKNEIGPNQGCAGQKISEIILQKIF